jgi:solute carrier family 25 protein 43
MAYDVLDKAWNKPRDKSNTLQSFVNGCLAACFAQTFSFPFDTIRKKMQAQSKVVPADMKPDVEFHGVIDAFRQTVKKNGILGLWKGNLANLAKVAPYGAFSY